MNSLPLIVAVALAVLFLILFVLTASTKSVVKSTAKGPFGIITNVDSTTLTKCGPSKTETCEFTKTSLAACESQCDLLKAICNQFTFNQSQNLMKIVSGEGNFASPGVNLFIRQTI